MSDSSMGYYNYIIGQYIESYLNISNPSTPSENIVVRLAQPFLTICVNHCLKQYMLILMK